MIKVAIIGNNPDAARFINNCELIDDYANADVVVISGELNYRSAVTKYNKIPKDKLVIALGNACEFVAKRNSANFISFTLRNEYKNCTLPFKFKDTGCVSETLPENKVIIFPTNPFRVLGYVGTEYYHFTEKVQDMHIRFLQENQCPVIMLLRSVKNPYCLCMQVNPKFIDKSAYLCKYINQVICEYKNLL